MGWRWGEETTYRDNEFIRERDHLRGWCIHLWKMHNHPYKRGYLENNCFITSERVRHNDEKHTHKKR